VTDMKRNKVAAHCEGKSQGGKLAIFAAWRDVRYATIIFSAPITREVKRTERKGKKERGCYLRNLRLPARRGSAGVTAKERKTLFLTAQGIKSEKKREGVDSRETRG